MNDPRYLRAFCATTNERQLHEPFSRGPFTYASDAVIAVRIPRVQTIGVREGSAPGIENLQFPEPGRCTFPLPVLSPREFTPCPERVAVSADACPKTCPECAGLGRAPVVKRIQIGLSDFNSEYLRSMKMFLRNVKTTRPAISSANLEFTFDDGCGILAGMEPFD